MLIRFVFILLLVLPQWSALGLMVAAPMVSGADVRPAAGCCCKAMCCCDPATCPCLKNAPPIEQPAPIEFPARGESKPIAFMVDAASVVMTPPSSAGRQHGSAGLLNDAPQRPARILFCTWRT